MSEEYLNEELVEDEIMEEEEVKDSKLKVLASKAKNKINFRTIGKTLAVGAGLVAAYALGAKTGSKNSGSDDVFIVDLDSEEDVVSDVE